MNEVQIEKGLVNNKRVKKPRHKKKHKKDKLTKKGLIRGAILDFCCHTSIHGVQYLGEKGRHGVERLLWSICLFFSFLFCVICILNIWIKWQDAPVIITFSEKPTKIWSIPFPAITVCPIIKTQRDIFNYHDFYENFRNGLVDSNHENFKYFTALSHVCEYRAIEKLDLSTNQTFDIIATLNEVAPQKNNTIKSFMSEQMGLFAKDDPWKKTVTDSGICYTFNALGPDDLFRYRGSADYGENYSTLHGWSLEAGYNRYLGNQFKFYPRPVLTAGINQGIDMYLIGSMKDTDILCGGPGNGFNVLIHSPDEMPQIRKHNFRVPFGKEAYINVQPAMTTTSTLLRDYDPKRRQCNFNDDRSLKYFQYYTEGNCKIECLANLTQKLCDCIPFWIPAPPNAIICNATKFKCIQKLEKKMNYADYLGDVKLHTLGQTQATLCNCLPACTTLTYSTDVSQADCNIKAYEKVLHRENITMEYGIRFARIKIGFQNHQFYSSRRSELYGTTDFLASVGGILGIFVGISTLSFVEVIYFCTFRFCGKRPRKV